MINKEGLISDLVNNGKGTRSWDEIAKQYNIVSGEKARAAWKRHRKVGKIIAKVETANYITGLEDKVISLEEDVKNSKAELVYRSKNEIRTLEELIQKTNIDLKKWKISKWVQNYWGNSDTPHWQVKAFLEELKPEEVLTIEFKDFLKTYKPRAIVPVYNSSFDIPSLLILNKQDSHLNKFDELGNNDLEQRFKSVEDGINKIVGKSALYSSLSIVYVIGSDEFNSEWSGTTTKGTPQRNIGSFHNEFEEICNHEVRVIENLLSKSKYVEIKYILGNHDEYVGWHLIHWLQAYFKDQPNLSFDIGPVPTKYMRFSNSAIMFNHGNDMKPQKLAQIFPIEFKKEWSYCDYYYIFTGDKHTEKSMDFSGITFYSLPALSTGKSSWDLKMGNVGNRSEITGFLIQEGKGISDIYKEPIL